MKILITGGTGFLGRQLLDALIEKDHELVLTSRKQTLDFAPFPAQIISWPVDFSRDQEALQGVEAVIHLAGENISDGRWSAERKKSILNSRVAGTQNVADIVRRLPTVKTFISASAVGYYGASDDRPLDEAAPAGTGFLAEVCKAWEAEAEKAARAGLRIVLLRTGVVFGRSSGALAKLEPLYRNKVGGPVGSGHQIMSWIHESDWVRAVLFALENSALGGPINLTAPEPVSNKAFSKIMSEIFKQPIEIPAPGFALKLALGEMSTIVLDGQKVIPKKLEKNHFQFHYPDLKSALLDLFCVNPESSEKIKTPDDLYTASQWVPHPIEKVFQFFCDETNLEEITPPLLQFKVLGKSTQKIGTGTLINYKLKVHGIPMTWQTLIENWNPPHSFVDTQLKGPYEKWHHTHMFSKARGGTLMRDRVRYRLPLGGVGRLGGHWLVKKDVQKIFDYRRKVVSEKFA